MSNEKKRVVIHKMPNLVAWSDGSMRVDNLRFSHVHADVPWAKKDSKDENGNPAKPKFSVVGLLPKKTHEAEAKYILGHINKMLKDKNIPKMASKDRFLRNGDDHADPNYEGHYTINLSNSADNPPFIRDAARAAIPKEKVKSKLKSGYWGSLLFSPWFQDNKHGKKINANFLGIQVVKEDEVFGSAGLSEEDIDDSFDPVGDSSGFGDDDDDDDI